MRQCLGCREHKPKRELLRVVRSPEGEISLDPRGKKPGRGAYICPDRACFAKARNLRATIREAILRRTACQAPTRPQVLSLDQ